MCRDFGFAPSQKTPIDASQLGRTIGFIVENKKYGGGGMMGEFITDDKNKLFDIRVFRVRKRKRGWESSLCV